MPLYDYICLKCEEVQEVYISLDSLLSSPVTCSTCLTLMKRQITVSSRPSSMVYPYFCEGSRMTFTGPRDRERKLRSKGLVISG